MRRTLTLLRGFAFATALTFSTIYAGAEQTPSPASAPVQACRPLKDLVGELMPVAAQLNGAFYEIRGDAVGVFVRAALVEGAEEALKNVERLIVMMVPDGRAIVLFVQVKDEVCRFAPLTPEGTQRAADALKKSAGVDA